MVALEMGKKKKRYLSYQNKSCKEDKTFHQKHEFYTFKLPQIKLSWLDNYEVRKNVAHSQKVTF